jgi:sugar phosphate isomerase/epimerase
MNRRHFIAGSLAGLAGMSLPLRSLARSRAGWAPPGGIGVQLYTLRTEMEKDLEGTLRAVGKLGFREVEFAGYFGKAPKDVKAVLDSAGLSAPAAHMPLDMLLTSPGPAFETAHTIGHRIVVVPWIPPDRLKSLDDFKRLADSLNKAGEAADKANLRLAYHNHDFEFATFDGKVGFDTLIGGTDPRLVKLELDLYWVAKAKHDSLAYFASHKDRFVAVHVKDLAANGDFAEVGRGTLDFRTLLPAAQKAGVTHFFVEQDRTPGPPLESVKISLDYLNGLA